MKFFKNLINRKNEELSPEEIEHVNNTISKNNGDDLEKKEGNYIDIKKGISQLNNLEEINRLRNLLDQKEREITGNHELYKPEEENYIEKEEKNKEEIIKTEKKFDSKNSTKNNEKYFGEIDIEENIDDEKLDTQTYHVENYKKEIEKIEDDNGDKITQEVEFIDNEDEEYTNDMDKDSDENNADYEDLEENNYKKISQKEIITQEDEEDNNNNNEENNKEKSEKYIEIHHEDEDEFGNELDKDYQTIIKELREIFKIENIIETSGETCEFDSINGEEINYIGIRNKNSFHNDMSAEDENAWFITRIKKLEKLKNFKMLKSEPEEKDLVWVRDNHPPILISFRTTGSLENEDDFPFPM
ncbi:MAG: hypothetical protein KC550_01135 [Nanoarchaeota archaeon]|nr:hypothetical protein [Nanoarchaeota archaeon]